MSVVTNAILHMGTLDPDCGEDNELLKEVNAFFAPGRGFRLIDGENVGGTKCLECTLAIGAFNGDITGANLETFVEHLRNNVRWPYDCERISIQLLVKDQNDMKFRVIDIFPEET